MTKQIAVILLIFILLSSCKTKKKKLEKSDLNGYWELEGGGEIIELNDSTTIGYFNSKVSCYPKWKGPRKDFNEETPAIILNSDESFTNRFTKNRYVKLKEKPALCKELTKEQKKSNEYNFETLWQTFNEQYAFFLERKIDWNSLKMKYKSKFNEQTKPFEFYILLKEMIFELDDKHSNIYVPYELQKEYEKWNSKNKRDTTNYYELIKTKILKKYIKDIKKYNNGIIAYGKINKDLAYIQLNEMDRLADYNLGNEFDWDTYWKKTEESSTELQDNINGVHKIMKSIIQDISNTKACIIDLRLNPGGYDEVGLAVLSHFVKNEQEAFKKKRRIVNKFSETQITNI